MRRRYVISYDVSDDKRRTQLFNLLSGNGDRIQYSVFLAELTGSELIRLRGKVGSIINHSEDQCLFVDMGREGRPLDQMLETVGRSYQPPSRSMIV